MLNTAMDCPHCNESIVWNPRTMIYWSEGIDNELVNKYTLLSQPCPDCYRSIIVLNTQFQQLEYDLNAVVHLITYKENDEIFYPKYKQIKDIGDEVPEAYKKEFIEAYLVAQISPKASAALSRLLLQQILSEELKIEHNNLNEQMDIFIEKSNATQALKDVIDAIKQVGKFAAHQNKSKTTGEIVDVEPGEAEWLLKILEMLLTYTFVQPKREHERIKKLNQKLQDLGKKPLKLD